MNEQNPFLQNYTSLQNQNAFVFCCGSNRFQELGFKGINHFQVPQGLEQSILPDKIIQIVSALNHTLILTEKGVVLGLGSNEQGNLAQDPKTVRFQNQPLPIQIDTKREVAQIACGKFKSLCLLDNGLVYEWGSFYKDEIQHKPKQIEFKDNSIIVQIGCGLNHCLALSEDGILFSWGGFILNKNHGQLGQGHLKPIDQPQQVEFFKNKTVSGFECGGYHSIAILQNDEIYSWGQGKYGQLGTGKNSNCLSPTKISIPEDVFITQASCGRQHTLLLTNEGHVFAFGLNSKGQLGLGKTKNIFQPQKIKYLLQKYIIAIYCGSNHSILHVEPQYVYVSGQNTNGQLGLGHLNNVYRFQYQNLLIQKNIYEIFAGGDHSWFVVDYDDPFYEADPPSSLEHFSSEQEGKQQQISITNSWVEGQQRKGTLDSINRKSISSESRINISQTNNNFQIKSVNKLNRSSLLEQLEQNNQIQFHEDDNINDIEQIQQNKGQKITFGSKDISKNTQNLDRIQLAIKDKKITFGPAQQKDIQKFRQQLQENKIQENLKIEQEEEFSNDKKQNSFRFSSQTQQDQNYILSSQQEEEIKHLEHVFEPKQQDQNDEDYSHTNIEDTEEEKNHDYDTEFIYKFCFTKLTFNHSIFFIFFESNFFDKIESILRRIIRQIKNEVQNFNLVQMITYKEYLNQNNRKFDFIDNLKENIDEGLVLYFYQQPQNFSNNLFEESDYLSLDKKESSMGILYQIKNIQQIFEDKRWNELSQCFIQIYNALRGKVKHIIHYEYRSLNYKQFYQKIKIIYVKNSFQNYILNGNQKIKTQSRILL